MYMSGNAIIAQVLAQSPPEVTEDEVHAIIAKWPAKACEARIRMGRAPQDNGGPRGSKKRT